MAEKAQVKPGNSLQYRTQAASECIRSTPMAQGPRDETLNPGKGSARLRSGMTIKMYSQSKATKCRFLFDATKPLVCDVFFEVIGRHIGLAAV
jgi:hypothetical protein